MKMFACLVAVVLVLDAALAGNNNNCNVKEERVVMAFLDRNLKTLLLIIMFIMEAPTASLSKY